MGAVAAGPWNGSLPLSHRELRAAAARDAGRDLHGEVPDAFRGGAEVVIKGSLTDDDVLEVAPDGITAKCPGKYAVASP